MVTIKAGYSLVKVKLLDSDEPQTFYCQAYKNPYLQIGSEYACTYHGVKDTRVEVVEMDVDLAAIVEMDGTPDTLLFPRRDC